MKKLVTAVILLVGFLITFFIFQSEERLPKYGQIHPFEAESSFGGEYSTMNSRSKLIVFFFTNCPDICPLTLANLTGMQKDLAEKGWLGKELDIVAITLDPERDTAKEIRQYANNFVGDKKGWHWLRTSIADTKDIAKSFQMVYQKQKTEH